MVYIHIYIQFAFEVYLHIKHIHVNSLKWFMKVISDVCMHKQYHVFLPEANVTYTYHIKAVKFELFIIYKCWYLFTAIQTVRIRPHYVLRCLFLICTIHFTSLITGKYVRRTPPPCILGPWPSWRLYTLCSMLYPNYKRPGVTTRIILPWFANSSTSSWSLHNIW